jgi:hypothetical protein
MTVCAALSVQAGDLADRYELWRAANPAISNAVIYSYGDVISEVIVDGAVSATHKTAIEDISAEDLAAWRDARDFVPEIASLESDLTNAIATAFGVMPPYSAGVQANYKTILRNQMRQARADVEAATTLAELRAAQKTLNQRQEIINIVRELMALKHDWTISEIGQ